MRRLAAWWWLRLAWHEARVARRTAKHVERLTRRAEDALIRGQGRRSRRLALDAQALLTQARAANRRCEAHAHRASRAGLA